jgi:TolA-binding protein
MTAWNALLTRAQTALSRGAFIEAQRDAEALLKAPLPREMRGRALLVAADAAYATGGYSTAARHYNAFIAQDKNAPEVAHATIALGWTRLRSGDPNGARAVWNGLADTRPADTRAPVGLLLAAEVASQTGDRAGAERLLDRLIAWYPSSSAAAPGLLSRASLLLRRQHEAAALRDVDEVVRAHGPSAIDNRRKLIEAVASTDKEPVVTSPPARSDGDAGGAYGEALDRFAARLLDKQHREETPYLLHAVVLLAAKRGWADPLTGTLADRLVGDFPSYPPASRLLARVGEAAAAAGQWPLARRSWETMLAHAPMTMGRTERLMLAEAQLRTGETAQARQYLEQLAATPRGEETPRALLLLAQMQTTAGDRGAALAAHERLQQDYPRFPRSAGDLLSHARLLVDVNQHGRARPMLQKVVEASEGEVAAEAAYRLGQGFDRENKHAAAVEWYLTAVYVAEQSTWARQALLGAGRSLTKLNEKKEALAVYWKLLPGAGGPDSAADRGISGEAAYHAGEILRDADHHADALVMFQTSAQLTAGSPAERQALLAALQSLAGAGDRQAAEVIYRRLQQAGANESQLAQARQALRVDGRPSPPGSPSESALPKPPR